MRFLALVVERQAALQVLGQCLGVEHGLGRQVGQGLDQVEQVAPVAVGELGQPRAGGGVERQRVAQRRLGPLQQGQQRLRPTAAPAPARGSARSAPG